MLQNCIGHVIYKYLFSGRRYLVQLLFKISQAKTKASVAGTVWMSIPHAKHRAAVPVLNRTGDDNERSIGQPALKAVDDPLLAPIYFSIYRRAQGFINIVPEGLNCALIILEIPIQL